jgi:hypothetical protein
LVGPLKQRYKNSSFRNSISERACPGNSIANTARHFQAGGLMEISRWCQPPDNAKKNIPAPAGAKERR